MRSSGAPVCGAITASTLIAKQRVLSCGERRMGCHSELFEVLFATADRRETVKGISATVTAHCICLGMLELVHYP